jgi:hypothetical protein
VLLTIIDAEMSIPAIRILYHGIRFAMKRAADTEFSVHTLDLVQTLDLIGASQFAAQLQAYPNLLNLFTSSAVKTVLPQSKWVLYQAGICAREQH